MSQVKGPPEALVYSGGALALIMEAFCREYNVSYRSPLALIMALELVLALVLALTLELALIMEAFCWEYNVSYRSPLVQEWNQSRSLVRPRAMAVHCSLVALMKRLDALSTKQKKTISIVMY